MYLYFLKFFTIFIVCISTFYVYALFIFLTMFGVVISWDFVLFPYLVIYVNIYCATSTNKLN